MIPFETMIVLPRSRGSPSRQAYDALIELVAQLRAAGRPQRTIVMLRFFVDTSENAAHDRRRARLLAIVREFFQDKPPPASVIAQAPEGHVALEATVLTADNVTVARDPRYTLATGPGVRQLHVGGIECEGTNPRTCARKALNTLEAILRREDMTFGHVVRQWNYIEKMLDIRDGHQAYQDFNDIRASVYSRARFPAGYPAATGIGQAAGGVAVECIAVDAPGVTIEPISNPRQTDAHHYSPGQLVGASAATPKFERAKRVDEVTFVSGTAAIVGERTVHVGDVAAQTKTTIDNIAALLGDRPLTDLRAYVKHGEDIPTVRRLCEAAFGPIPALYVRADICRDDLLVELEGTAGAPAAVRSSHA